MSPDNSRVKGAGAYCLVDTDRKHFVFFAEDTDSVTVDLRGMPGSQKVIAVDTRADYDEKDIGSLVPGIYKIQLRTTSDWAIAVGNFAPLEQAESSR